MNSCIGRANPDIHIFALEAVSRICYADWEQLKMINPPKMSSHIHYQKVLKGFIQICDILCPSQFSTVGSELKVWETKLCL